MSLSNGRGPLLKPWIRGNPSYHNGDKCGLSQRTQRSRRKAESKRETPLRHSGPRPGIQHLKATKALTQRTAGTPPRRRYRRGPQRKPWIRGNPSYHKGDKCGFSQRTRRSRRKAWIWGKATILQRRRFLPQGTPVSAEATPRQAGTRGRGDAETRGRSDNR